MKHIEIGGSEGTYVYRICNLFLYLSCFHNFFTRHRLGTSVNECAFNPCDYSVYSTGRCGHTHFRFNQLATRILYFIAYWYCRCNTARCFDPCLPLRSYLTPNAFSTKENPADTRTLILRWNRAFTLYEACTYTELIAILASALVSMLVWSFVLCAVKRRVEESNVSTQWKNAPLLLISMGMVALALYAWDIAWLTPALL